MKTNGLIATFITLILVNIKHSIFFSNLKDGFHSAFNIISFKFKFPCKLPRESLTNLSPLFLKFWDHFDMDEKRIMRIQLPGNSSDLNPLENLWVVIKRILSTAQEIFVRIHRESGERLFRSGRIPECKNAQCLVD